MTSRWRLDVSSVLSFEASANYVTTRAITIDAQPDAVWAWLEQIGQDRGGFYTHNWVERLLRSGIPDTWELKSEWGRLRVGDLVRTNRPIRGNTVGWTVLGLEPTTSLVLQSSSMPRGTYAFVLRPQGDRTRFLVRDRAHWNWTLWPFLFLIWEPLHAYMETGLLRGLKERAEQHRSVTSVETRS